MENYEIRGIILAIIEEMQKNHSWNGQTNIQKAIYLLQDMLKVPLNFNFLIYYYGPFSFDLREEIEDMISNNYLDIDIPDERYGPKIVNGNRATVLEKKATSAVNKYKNEIEFIGRKLGRMGIKDLEKIGTANYVLKHLKDGNIPPEEILIQIKPHIDKESAIEAITKVEQMESEYKSLCA